MIDAIPLPLPHIGSVNAWLLRGAPLTLVDTGPRSDEALTALEAALGQRGLRIEDIELVIGTHHHHDHIGLAATIKRRSGARIAVIDRAADYARSFSEHIAAEQRFARELMRAHGVPEDLFAVADDLWNYIDRTGDSFEADVRLADGDRIVAGGRELTARMPVTRMLTGHGPIVYSIREVVERQRAQHRRRCRQIMRILDRGGATAFDIARRMWSDRIVREQPLFVLWETLGHLDLLLDAGIAREQPGDDDPAAPWRYSLTRRRATPRARREPPAARRTGGMHVVHSH